MNVTGLMEQIIDEYKLLYFEQNESLSEKHLRKLKEAGNYVEKQYSHKTPSQLDAENGVIGGGN